MIISFFFPAGFGDFSGRKLSYLLLRALLFNFSHSVEDIKTWHVSLKYSLWGKMFEKQKTFTLQQIWTIQTPSRSRSPHDLRAVTKCFKRWTRSRLEARWCCESVVGLNCSRFPLIRAFTEPSWTLERLRLWYLLSGCGAALVCRLCPEAPQGGAVDVCEVPSWWILHIVCLSQAVKGFFPVSWLGSSDISPLLRWNQQICWRLFEETC